jgi:actin-like ATPase involved in cell morphogenesis/streptogramin lyase
MPYALGIDVGTTFTAAAIWRDDRVELVALESHRMTVPTVVASEDGSSLRYGDAAIARAAGSPSSVVRDFKRRLGDSVPVFVASSPYSADRLLALFAAWVVEVVATQLGEPPSRIVVTHPANWTEFQRHLLSTALEQAGMDRVELLSEPRAAAIDFLATAHLEHGELVLVYDLGGGTFDLALLRRVAHGLEEVGDVAGIERLGGIDFDEAVFQFVLTHVSADVLANARQSEAGVRAITQLRARCVEAKEALSSDVAADVPVVLPGLAISIRITRAEFETMIRPMLQQTVELARRVLDGADIAISSVLMVGGSARIPLVSDMVRSQLNVPVRIDAHPKLVVARGAARWAGTRPSGKPSQPPAVTPAGEKRSRRRGVLLGAAGILVVLGLTGVLMSIRASSDGSPGAVGIVDRVDLTLDEPADVVGAGGTAWVSDASGVHVVDLAGQRPPSIIELDADRPINLDLSTDSLWVTRASGVDRVNRETGAVDEQLELEFVPNDILATAEGVWISDYSEGGLWHLDPSARPPSEVDVLPAGILTADLADGAGAIWVTATVEDQVVRVDPATRDATTFPVPGCGPVGISVEGDSVWLACSTSRAVERLDAETGSRERITAEGSSQIGQPWGIVAGQGGAWVTDHVGGLVSHITAEGHVSSIDLDEPLDGITPADPSGVLVSSTKGLVHVDLRDGTS